MGEQISETLARQDVARTEHLNRRACLEPLNYESGEYKAVGNVEAMIKQERLREDWTRIKAATKDRRGASVPSLEIPEETDDVGEMWDLLKTRRTSAKDLQWRDIFCEDEIEEKMIDWCTLHFAQASGTPLASPQGAEN